MDGRTLIRSVCFACISFCLFITNRQAGETLYKVAYVYDCDTVKLPPINTLGPQYDIQLRITELDAPERNQPFGLKSRLALIKLCPGNNIFRPTEIVAKDKYQRSLGRLQCNQVDASLYLVELGLAWHNARYVSDVALYNAEINARVKRLGLWADDNPIPPWVWRRMHAN